MSYFERDAKGRCFVTLRTDGISVKHPLTVMAEKQLTLDGISRAQRFFKQLNSCLTVRNVDEAFGIVTAENFSDGYEVRKSELMSHQWVIVCRHGDEKRQFDMDFYNELRSRSKEAIRLILRENGYLGEDLRLRPEDLRDPVLSEEALMRLKKEMLEYFIAVKADECFLVRENSCFLSLDTCVEQLNTKLMMDAQIQFELLSPDETTAGDLILYEPYENNTKLGRDPRCLDLSYALAVLNDMRLDLDEKKAFFTMPLTNVAEAAVGIGLSKPGGEPSDSLIDLAHVVRNFPQTVALLTCYADDPVAAKRLADIVGRFELSALGKDDRADWS